MRIYVDYDDCLCETAKSFSALALQMFGKDVPYEKIRYFNLQKAFELTDEQYDELMTRGHEPGVLLAYEETPGASRVIHEWLSEGHEVSIITGRPFHSYEPSRIWLDRHGFEDVRLYCLDKYGRENYIKDSNFSLKLDDYLKMEFDFAVEDSPQAFWFFDHLPELQVLVFDRPWNQDAEFPGENYRRCHGWEDIRAAVKPMQTERKI